MKLQLTYDEWKAAGFQVQKGSKCVGKNTEGKALFDISQTKRHGIRSDHCDYDVSDYEYDRDMGDVYFHDKDWY